MVENVLCSFFTEAAGVAVFGEAELGVGKFGKGESVEV